MNTHEMTRVVTECIEGKQYHDVVGGYQQLDLLPLHVNRSRQNPVSFSDDEAV